MKKAPDTFVNSIGANKGRPRIYLDGLQASRAGFAPGEKFDIAVEGGKVVLRKNQDGSRTVCSRKRGEAEYPVIDINSKELLEIFDGMDAVRVVVSPDRVYLLPLASEIRKRERYERLAGKVERGEPMDVGSLSHGGGVLAHAIHEGLAASGLESNLVFANEIREDLIGHAALVNKAWTDETTALAMPMQEVVQDDWLMGLLPKVEILEMGLPCSGASPAGVSKRALEKMEDHPEVGHLVFSALVILNRTQPAVVLLENVPQYAQSASAQILRHQLRDMGYDCQEAILEGKDFGCLENRIRWCLVATTKGVAFDFEDLEPRVRIVRRVSDVLDKSIGPDDPRWSGLGYLKDKAVRDKANGKRFQMQVIEEGATQVPTLRKGYAKGGSTDPVLANPENPDLMRRFTAGEHARIKGVPERLIAGLSETMAHELLGQGIVYEPFKAVGKRIGEAILAAIQKAAQAPEDPLEPFERPSRRRAIG